MCGRNVQKRKVKIVFQRGRSVWRSLSSPHRHDLLRNSCMYTSRRHANVEIGRAEPGGKATYLVNDEGSGLDARSADWVFQGYIPRLISR